MTLILPRVDVPSLGQIARFEMKAALIRLFLVPSGIVSVIGFCVLILILVHVPLPIDHPTSQGGRDEFPHQRRGGGTHWTMNPGDVA